MMKHKQTPKQSGFIMPAEWETHKGCWMAWPCRGESWHLVGINQAREAYAQIAATIAEFEPVFMLVDPKDELSARLLCPPPIELVSLPLNDSWTRDTGPTFLLNEQGELAGIDWIHNAWGDKYGDYELDDQIASSIIHKTGAQYFKAPIVLEGGAIHVDGEGTLLTTRECLLNKNRNPSLSQKEIEDYLVEYLNVRKIIWLNRGLFADETDGHVDEIACFCAPAKVLCLVTSDTQDVNYRRLQENLDILSAATDAQGRSLEIITLEQPPATFMQNRRLTLSYINFYLANGGVVIPSFGYPEYDTAAFKLFMELFPERKIVQLNALNIFAGGGGLHCITQQQPSV